MASTRLPFTPRLTGAELLELSRRKGRYVVAACRRSGDLGVSEAPSCIFVGPIDTASQETLEALYLQARDAYYSGRPIIVDDMFDRVELKLRWYGSKSVVKYPRCSIRQQSTYSDAEEDLSQAFVLASIWVAFLVLGGSVCLVSVVYALSLANHDTFYGDFVQRAPEYLSMINGLLFMALGAVVGYPIVSASVGVLRRLWINELAALRGACPNCGEEVFAFIRSDKSNSSAHRADCHVCESTLEFRTKVQSTSRLGRRWVYGRVYLVSRRRSSRRR
ncbi:hypothetical protein MLD38_011586 [Melastoma candidum]|uniref:Uncharacterized protein n=1 Tax=Melastoma candidum TaxID=119954 RepID=A0ACB9R3K4_9MYRT|nr:hypothetical protein MLD38_011586 [Melastoma candidum]